MMWLVDLLALSLALNVILAICLVKANKLAEMYKRGRQNWADGYIKLCGRGKADETLF